MNVNTQKNDGYTPLKFIYNEKLLFTLIAYSNLKIPKMHIHKISSHGTIHLLINHINIITFLLRFKILLFM